MASRSRLPPAPPHRVADVLLHGYFPPQRSDYNLPPPVTRLPPTQVQALCGLGRTSPQEEGLCPICQQEWRTILVPKVNLGCAHSVCSSCFQESSAHGLRNCPLCRKDLRHLIAQNNERPQVDAQEEQRQAAEVMASMGTTPAEQLDILMTIQRRQVPQPLVVFPEPVDGGEYLMRPEDRQRGINPFISNILTPVTPV